MLRTGSLGAPPEPLRSSPREQKKKKARMRPRPQVEAGCWGRAVRWRDGAGCCSAAGSQVLGLAWPRGAFCVSIALLRAPRFRGLLDTRRTTTTFSQAFIGHETQGSGSMPACFTFLLLAPGLLGVTRPNVGVHSIVSVLLPVPECPNPSTKPLYSDTDTINAHRSGRSSHG